MWDIGTIRHINDKAIRESMQRGRKRMDHAADALYMRLVTDGVVQRIQPEDIERLAAPNERAAFMRRIVIELMVCLRPD